MNRHQIIAVIVLTLIFCFEQYFPNRKRVSHWWRHLRCNCILGGLNGFLTGVSSALMSVCVICWMEDHSVGLLRMFRASSGLKLCVAFVLFDFWIYAWHWVNHQIPLLWRFHRVHHSDPAMDMSTALRFHPFEILLSSMLNIIIIALIGMDLSHLVLYKGIFHANVLFQHSNVRISPKVDYLMRALLVSPNMHRIHHSNIQKGTNSNYSSVFSFWDRLFGTYCRRDGDLVTFGLDRWMEEKWQTVVGLLKLPFKNIEK